MAKANMWRWAILILALGAVIGYCAIYFGGASAGAYDPASINSGDVAWMLASSALVMIMTPAVGFFYGGMVSSKNVVSVLKQSMLILSLVSIQWVVIGYSLAFGPDAFHGLIGNLSHFGLRGVGYAPDPSYAATIPALVYMIFQAMFAIVTPALIIGAFVGRIRFKTLVVFTLLWSTLVYDPIAHWVWSPNGWLHTLGALDFAGGTVVHMSAGFSALAAAMLVGKRLDTQTPGNANVPFVILGAALLWFGWFGFNAGSALTAGPLAASAFVVTNTAAAAAALTWVALSWAEHKKPLRHGRRYRCSDRIGRDHACVRFRRSDRIYCDRYHCGRHYVSCRPPAFQQDAGRRHARRLGRARHRRVDRGALDGSIRGGGHQLGRSQRASLRQPAPVVDTTHRGRGRRHLFVRRDVDHPQSSGHVQDASARFRQR